MIKFWILLILTCVIIYFGLKYIVGKINKLVNKTKHEKVGSYRIVRERYKKKVEYVVEVLKDNYEWENVSRHDELYNARAAKASYENLHMEDDSNELIKRTVID